LLAEPGNDGSKLAATVEATEFIAFLTPSGQMRVWSVAARIAHDSRRISYGNHAEAPSG
jgi:hypothetical protein